MLKRSFYCLLAILVLMLANAGLATARTNVILMMADDQGWGDVGYNGHKDLKTPHLDAMSEAGLRFDRFYAAAPVCSPTRGSCITGRHPYRYGIPYANQGKMLPEELTLAELLKKKGYATGHFGKWHLGTLTTQIKDANRGKPGETKHFSPPWQNGFDVCFSTESKVPTWDPMLKPKVGARSTWWDAVKRDADAVPYGTHYWSNGKLVKDNLGGDDSRVIMDRAIPFIRDAARREQPFFAIVWFHAPHLPVVAGPRYAAMYKQFDKHTQHYYGCITALDEQVGRLRKELRDLNIADDTIVFYCSDNGPEGSSKSPGSAGNLRGRKRSLYEGGVRVPGLMEWPAKIKQARRIAMPASTSDYLPTILDVVGVEMPDKRPLDGVSLLPLVEGKMTQRPEPIGFESRGMVTLVDNRFKLIYKAGGKSQSKKKGKEEKKGKTKPHKDKGTADGDASMQDAGKLAHELYDLVADPGEKTNVAAKHPAVVKKMAATVGAWRASCKKSAAGGDYVK